MHPWARGWVEHFNTYTEISPRGRGIKMWIKVPGSQGSLLPTLERMNLATEKDRSKERRHLADPESSGTGCSGLRESSGVPIKECEVYSAGRFFTVTGVRLEGTPNEIATVDERSLGALLEDMLRARVDRGRETEARARTELENARRARARRTSMGLELSDHELIEKARSAKQGGDFSALYDRGDLAKHGADHSRADLALCIRLAFWTAGDDNRIDQLFRASALYRDKWERADYRSATIAEALRCCRAFYSPRAKGNRSPKPEKQAQTSKGSGRRVPRW